ncbi:MAG: hypothetical protein GY847_25435 [Proteobacteria bacterium]|nr:hypothetical protein [Pseudomonadota bacterium]
MDYFEVSLCGLECSSDHVDSCPAVPWGHESKCFIDKALHPEGGICFLTGCETEWDCPVWQICESYKTCPDLQICQRGLGPECEVIEACDNAPPDGTICYPDNY